ncbi:MAG: hypothetical protein Q9227_001112 [Pyrenula ochraceoflavens]
MSYVALSYVWGGAESFKTLQSNVQQLQQDNALATQAINERIARTVRDTISLISILGERYLWVDSLCIVQDHASQKHTDINNMAAIFARASMTIISTNGNAGHGLRGLRGISVARNLTQRTFKIQQGVEVLLAQQTNDQGVTNHWKTRGWTYQEFLFSRRCIIFNGHTVRWVCDQARWYEDVKESHQKDTPKNDITLPRKRPSAAAISLALPDMVQLASMIGDYNSRFLTYSEDAHRAFAGTLSVLCRSFNHGFVYGLPISFLDVALLWQPSHTVEPRYSSTPGVLRFPSWSWLAWRGEIDVRSWYAGNSYIARGGSPRAVAAPCVIPLVQWTIHCANNSNRVESSSEWFELKQKYLDKATFIPPTGWTRYLNLPGEASPWLEKPLDVDDVPKYVYKFESDPETECWYPVPLDDTKKEPFVSDSLPLISCQTWRAWLIGGEQIIQERPTISLRTRDGSWAGALQLHLETRRDERKDWRKHGLIHQAFELVEISRGYCPSYSALRNLDEWDHAERPRSTRHYEFYNVLWIEWRNGTAFRKGLGRVEKRIWESIEREWIGLPLG